MVEQIIMIDGMIMNSNNSNESYSDDEKYQLKTIDLNYSDNKTNISSKQNSLINNRIERSNDYINTNLSQNINEDLRLEKTGWLNVKHWLTIQYYEKIELTSKNQWKRFWIWLKDSNIQLFNDYLDTNPQFTISTIDCLCYPSSEQQEYVFNLTTNTGDVYCFQSSNQYELDNWIRCIHTNCLYEINKNFLKSNLKQLENTIIYEKKLFKLTELQLKLTTDDKTRLIISKEIDLLEKNLELYNINLFRNKCYLLTFNKNDYLPNSKDLLSQISLKTKNILYNLHAFTPCGVYAYIISRKKFKLKKSLNSNEINQTILFNSNPPKKIILSINQTTITVGELLKRATDKLNFDINDYFLYFNTTLNNYFIPKLNDKLYTLTYSSIELCRKKFYQIILNNQLNQSGIEINQQDYPLKIFITHVNKGSEGERLGIIKGDEIIKINNFIIKNLDFNKFNRYLNQIPIILTLRSLKYDSIKKNTNNNEQLIKNIIFELIQTEKFYIQDIQFLIKQYIEPLKTKSTILSSDIIELLYNNIKSIQQLQIKFLENLELNLLNENILMSIAKTFIHFSKDFKIYSTYCSIHLRINRLLKYHNNNEYLKEFLHSCNPYNQHSLSFESYLIKPVQRIVKYPLFLQQLFIYCNKIDNNNRLFLKKSIKIMNKINQYINLMQKIYEEFGQTFEYFIKNSNKLIEFNLSELYAYGEIHWINIYKFISKKNYQYLKTFCFIFRNGCLLLVREQLNKKNQDLLSNNQINKNQSDCFIRFLPMNEIQVELIDDENNKYHNHTWQLIQINPKTLLKTYFRFANKDAQALVKTINHCISDSLSSKQKYLASSRSCHDLISNRYLEKNYSIDHRRNPSPIWKRRPISLRKRPLSMPNNKNFI